MQQKSDPTLSTPCAAIASDNSALLGITLVWHPEPNRIGEQFIYSVDSAALNINRYHPLFQQVGGAGVSLGYAGISREPLVLQRTCGQGEAGLLTLEVPHSRMLVEVNGTAVSGKIVLTAEELKAGVMLGLGRAVMLCLHWMHTLPKAQSIAGLQGVGSAAIALREQINQVAHTELPVLLLGETGTGKEVIARAIHALSPRQQAPLFTVNMAALTDGLAAADLFGASKGAYTGAQQTRKGWFAQAENATLFLDEIGNAPASIQPMLLRVLEDGSYRPLGAEKDQYTNARLIAATDQDLYSAAFNQPLLRRLEGVVIQLPPLRERREDIGVILRHVLMQSVTAGSTTTSPAALLSTIPFEIISAIANYAWPGNIRQLVHATKRIELALQHQDFTDWQRWLGLVQPQRANPQSNIASAISGVSARKPPAQLTEDDVIHAMSDNHWYIQGAAEQLGISRPSLYKLLERYARNPEQIPHTEIKDALQQHAYNIERCAAHLKTPTEALRRYLRERQRHLLQ